MGRVGENWLRVMQTADAMKPGAVASCRRTRRATTTSACCATSPRSPSTRRSRPGPRTSIGSIEPGKIADLVLWEPAFFGAKPKLVIKGGMINWALMGDPNASLATAAARHLSPDASAHSARRCPRPASASCLQAAYEDGIADRLELKRLVKPVERTRTVTKRDLVRNDATPEDRSRPGDVRRQGRRRPRDRATVRIGQPQPAVLLQLAEVVITRRDVTVDADTCTHARRCRRRPLGRGRLARPARGGASVDVLHLDQAEAQKSRLRKATAGGVEVAVSLDRGTQLRDGDILVWDEARRAAIRRARRSQGGAGHRSRRAPRRAGGGVDR